MEIQKERYSEAALTAVGAVWLLVVAHGRHAYGDYILLRLAVTVGALYWAARVYRDGPRGLLWPFVAVAMLLNPVLPIRMHRTDWRPVDLWLGILLLGWAGYWFIRSANDGKGGMRLK